MKVLLVNGSPYENDSVSEALQRTAAVLQAHGIETEGLWLGKEKLRMCTGCGKCIRHGKCIFPGVNETIEDAENIDGMIIAAPVWYGKPDDQVISFLDRIFNSASDRFAYKPASYILISRRDGVSEAHRYLSHYFAKANMPVIGVQKNNVMQEEDSASRVPEMVGDTMGWLLNCIRAGQESGIGHPQEIPKRIIDFTR